MPNYGKQKSGRAAGGARRHTEHNAPGGPANPFGQRPDKAALVERMRAAARKGQTADADPDPGPDLPAVRPEGGA